MTNLKSLSLAHINLVTLPRQLFKDLHTLDVLNISRNNLKRLTYKVFKHLYTVATLDLTRNSLDWVNEKSFKQLQKPSTIVYVDEYSTCCSIESATCSFESPPSPFISCKRLLRFSIILRVVVWIVAICTISGYSFVLLTRFEQEIGNIQSLLITNLSLSDLLMGVYLIS